MGIMVLVAGSSMYQPLITTLHVASQLGESAKQTVSQMGTVVLTPTQYGSEPQYVVCPHCRTHGLTTVETGPNTMTHLFALLLCIIGLWCCVPCPYCMDSCMAKKHYCSTCKVYLGESK
ncbi:hypothetical protein WN51_07820 [Melipona quadrifasciata]|uniref:LITAF domain-containing protein n=1 Tax=Melipona quadrifasciata TaxID=166423 RepID=A0A0M9A913_9HYME|nr:hypothetical protein WN51_07820 [Melipona quadrifasciata]